MIGRLKLFLAAMAAAVALTAVGAEASRIGVVNLERVFREYYRSRIAEDAIREQFEVYRGHLLKLNNQLRQLQQEARTALINSQNIALDQQERDKYRQAAEAKEQEVAACKAEIELYSSERATSMRKLEEQKRGEIMAEIKKEIERRAAAEGYSFVFDSSGRTLNEQPAVLFFPAGCDLTEAVIRELNRGRSGGPEAPAATEPVSSAVSQPSGLPASSGVPQEPNPQSGEDQ